MRVVHLLGAIAFIILVQSLVSMSGCTIDHDRAMNAAKAFIRANGIEVDHYTCATFDTDDDSYNSCSFFKDGVATQWECSNSMWTGDGDCRKPKLSAPPSTP